MQIALIKMFKPINLIRFIFILVFITLYSCQDQVVKRERNTKNIVTFAKGFELYKTEDYTKLVIKNPYPNADKQFVYYLVNKNQHPKLTNAIVINVPIKSIVATSTTHIPMIDALNEANSLIGFPNLDYISTPSVRKLITEQKLIDLGNNMQLNTEILLNLKPDVLIGFSMQGQNKMYETIQKAGIPVILDGDWLESTPLGRAEWLKFFGALYQKEALADSLFKAIVTDYKIVTQLALTALERPTILSGNINGNIWNLPAGQSYSAQFLKDANTKYYWQNTTGNGSLNLSFETVFNQAQNAQYWIGAGPYKSFVEMKKTNPHYREFRAFKTKQVYTFALTLGKTGGTLYYEEAALKPNVVLKDLIKVVHPELLPNYIPYFLKKLN